VMCRGANRRADLKRSEISAQTRIPDALHVFLETMHSLFDEIPTSLPLRASKLTNRAFALSSNGLGVFPLSFH